MSLPPIPEELYRIPERASSWPLPDRPDHPAYGQLLDAIERAPLLEGAELFRAACVNDFYFFNRYCHSFGNYLVDDPYLKGAYKRIPWVQMPWLFDRCRELQAEPDGYLDLWPRYYFKTTLITQNLSLWEFLVDPELTFGIGTYKVEMTGEAMLGQVKKECVTNERLRWNFPGTFYWDPPSESPEWSMHKIRFRQKNGQREPSMMVFSLLGALPTSFHFRRLVIDDMVTEATINSGDQIEKTREAWRRTGGLVAADTPRRMTGTHWAHNDPYKYVLDLGAVKLRYHDVYDEKGDVMLRSKEWLHGDGTYKNVGVRTVMGAVNFAAQMRNRPSLGVSQSFDPQWLSWYNQSPEEFLQKLRVYLLGDLATHRSGDSDYNCFAVLGVARGVPWPHFYLLDLAYDRMSLPESDDTLFGMVTRWRPYWTFIEQVAAQRDVDRIKEKMADRIHFRIGMFDSKVQKENRILRLQVPFEQRRIHFPRHIFGRHDGRACDLMQVLLQKEYLVWNPSSGADHDDILDTLSMAFAPELAKFIRPLEAVDDVSFEDAWLRSEGLAGPSNRDVTETLDQRSWAY